jgi:glycosyltransferase involved in cell wall biosynthesis
MSEKAKKVNPHVSVVIATRNRWDELQQAIESCLSQDYPAIEILVFDDASEKNIAKKVKDRYPTVKVSRSEVNVGQTVLRNKGFMEATGKYVFSLDDDAFYNDNHTISKVVEKLEKYTNVAVVALPYFEPKLHRMHWQGLEVNQNKSSNDKLIANFVACAAAFRKQAVIKMNGYRELFFFQGEEEDLAIRLMGEGFDIISSYVEPLTHTFSGIRDWKALHINGTKNSILFTFFNAPLSCLFPRLVLTTIGTFWHGIVIKEPWLKLIGIIRGYRDCLKYWQIRRPVDLTTWRKFRRLLKKPEDYPVETKTVDGQH